MPLYNYLYNFFPSYRNNIVIISNIRILFSSFRNGKYTVNFFGFHKIENPKVSFVSIPHIFTPIPFPYTVLWPPHSNILPKSSPTPHFYLLLLHQIKTRKFIDRDWRNQKLQILLLTKRLLTFAVENLLINLIILSSSP